MLSADTEHLTADDLKRMLEGVRNKIYTGERTIPCKNVNQILFDNPSSRKPPSSCPFNQKGGKCKFAHTWDELRKPADYTLIKNPLRDGPIKIKYSQEEGNRDMMLLMNLADLYPTKITKVMQEVPAVNLGHLCSYWLKHNGKCPRWENCYFLHPLLPTYRRLTKIEYCKCAASPDKCSNKDKWCPFAHYPRELVAPKDFTIHDTEMALAWAGTDKIIVTSDNGPAHVPLRFAMNTVGFRYWLDTGATVHMNFCNDDFCDKFGECPNIHFDLKYWEEVPDTHLRPHAYLHLKPKPQRAGATAASIVQAPPVVTQLPATTVSKPVTSTPVPDMTNPPVKPPPGLIQAGGRSSASLTLINSQGALSNTKALPTYTAEPEQEVGAEAPAFVQGYEDNLLEYLRPPPAKPRFKEVGRPIPSMRGKWQACSERYSELFKQMNDSNKFIAICEPGSEIPRFVFNRFLGIGEGGSSKVFLGLKYDDGMEIALKRIIKPYSDSEEEDEKGEEESINTLDKSFKTEINLLKTRNSVMGLVRYFGHVVIQSDPLSDRHDPQIEHYIALELMECNLKELVDLWRERGIIGRRPAHFLTCQYIVGSVLRTLGDLWRGQGGVVHRDIKPENILVDVMKQIKLIDFGIAKELGGTNTTINTTGLIAGTARYAAPEQFHNQRPMLTSDLWSLGLVLYYLLTGEQNWPVVDNYTANLAPRLLEKSPLAELVPWPHKLAAVCHLLNHLLIADPQKRAWYSDSFERKKQCHENILRHPFFWSDRQATNFLVALGNLRSIDFIDEMARIESIIVELLNVLGLKYWWEILDPKLWAAKASWWVTKQRKERPLMLLRFIRNCYVHSTDSEEDLIFTERPYFLQLLPTLVVRLWEVCRQEHRLMSHLVLRSILLPIFTPSLHFPYAEPFWF